MPTINLTSVDGQCFQQSNPGGVKKVLAVLARNIVGEWPNAAVITAATGRITALPTLEGTVKFSEYKFPDGTAEYKMDDEGDPSYESSKHMVEFAMAGSSDALHGEMAKYRNAGAVFLIQDKTGDYIVAGSSVDAVYVKKNFATGKNGSDKRGYVLTGDVDGSPYGVLRLDAALVATLTVNALPA